MSTVANTAPAALTCAHRGHPTGFSATVDTTRGTTSVTVTLSCGCRLPTDTPVTISPFRSAPRVTTTSCDPVRHEVRRGPLATVPVFYTRSDTGVVHISTVLSDLTTRSAASPAALGAMLAGQPLPSPLTPMDGVFRLSPGAVLHHGAPSRMRLRLEEFDWRELLPKGFRRAEPPELVRTGLLAALADSPADCVAVSGGPASTLLAALATDLPARHVQVRMPVLDRRTDAIARFATHGLPEIDIVDGTTRWEALRDGHVPVLPERSDPWPDRVTAGQADRAVSGYGLGLLLAAASRPRRPRRRDLLTGEQVSPALWGRPFLNRHVPATNAHDALPGWFGPSALSALRTAQAASTTSHLVPNRRADRSLGPLLTQLTTLLEGCGISRVDSAGEGRATPLLPGLHPALVGAALALAVRGRAVRPADLLPDRWRPADPPVGGRDRLFAAAYVHRRLASPASHADLLHRLRDGGWVRADELAAVLAQPGARLVNSWPLHRLHVLATTHPELLGPAGGGRP